MRVWPRGRQQEPARRAGADGATGGYKRSAEARASFKKTPRDAFHQSRRKTKKKFQKLQKFHREKRDRGKGHGEIKIPFLLPDVNAVLFLHIKSFVLFCF